MSKLFQKYLIFYIYFSTSFLRENLFGTIASVDFIIIGFGILLYMLSIKDIILKRFIAIALLFSYIFFSYHFNSNTLPTSYSSSTRLPLIGSFIMALFCFTTKSGIFSYRKMLIAFVYGVATATIFQLIYAYIPYLAPEKAIIGESGRIQIAACNANELAILDCIAITILLFSDYFSFHKLKSLLFILFIYSALLTGSRTGIICISVIFLIYFYTSKQHLAKKVIICLIAFIVIYYILVTFMPESIFERITQIGGSASEVDEDGLSGRSDIWAHALQIWNDSTFWETIFGHGVYSFIYLVRLGLDAHNVFIKIILELGIIGFILLISIFLNRYRYGKLVSNKTLYYSIFFTLFLSFMTLSWYINSVVILIWSFLYNFQYLTSAKQ